MIKLKERWAKGMISTGWETITQPNCPNVEELEASNDSPKVEKRGRDLPLIMSMSATKLGEEAQDGEFTQKMIRKCFEDSNTLSTQMERLVGDCIHLEQTPTLTSSHRVDISKFSLKDFILRPFVVKDDNYVLGQAPVVSKPPAQKPTVSTKPKSTPKVTGKSLKPLGKQSESPKGSGKKSDTTPKQSASSKTSSKAQAKNAEWPLKAKLALGGLFFLIILLLIIAVSCCICGSSKQKSIMRPDLEMGLGVPRLRIPQRLRAHPLSRHRRMMSSRRSSYRSRRSYY